MNLKFKDWNSIKNYIHLITKDNAELEAENEKLRKKLEEYQLTNFEYYHKNEGDRCE